MKFISVRVITSNIDRLVSFYERVLDAVADRPVPIFAEFHTAVGTLAIGAEETLAPFGGVDVAQAAANRSTIIEFQVDDVDAEYDRLRDLIGSALVQEPTTMPWGNRSLLFRDPDGSLVNLFTPVTPEAIAKFPR